MNVAAIVARILLGTIFCFAGACGFFFANNPPPAPNAFVAEVQDVLMRSHWMLFVSAVQIIAGGLLIANRYVPLGLVLLGAVIYNILAFHLTIMPAGLPPALVVTLLYIIVAWPYRERFAAFFVARPDRGGALASDRIAG